MLCRRFLRIPAVGLLALLVTLAPSSPAHAASRPIVVLALQPEYGVDPAVARLLSEHLVGVIRDAGAFEKVLGQSDLHQLIGEEQSRHLAQCDSEGCLAEMANSFGAGFVLRGSIGKLGTSHLLGLKLLDVSRAAIVASVSERIKGEDGDTLLDGLPAAVAKLLDNAKTPHQLKVAAPAPQAVPVATAAPKPPTAAPPAPTAPPPVAAAPKPTAPPPAASSATPPAPPPEPPSVGGPPWMLIRVGALVLSGLSIALIAPIGAVATYAGVGLVALYLTKRPPVADGAGIAAATVVAALPLLIGAGAAALGVFTFTRSGD